MDGNKFDSYVNIMQGHPTIAHTNKDPEGIKWIREYLPTYKDSPRKTILALGCADGAEVHALNQLGYKATGITLGDNNVKHGKEKYDPNLDIREMDMHDLKFDQQTFNYAYSSHSFEHAFCPFIHIMEVFVVLKERGRWLLHHPTFVFESQETTRVSYHHPNVAPYQWHWQLFETCGFGIRNFWQHGSEDRWLLERKPLGEGVDSPIYRAYMNRINMYG